MGGQGGSGEGVVNYLNSILSQRGPNALPYAEDVKWTVRQHLLDLLQDFPSLALKHGEYTHNDGRGVHLLRAEGTVPMYYQNVKYNIPITMWLAEEYPRTAPIVYVVPTPDMVIKPRHQFVDSSGIVATPYLHNWAYPASNLIDLVHTLSILFGQEPPLFSKPPNWIPPPPAAVPYQARPSPQTANPVNPSDLLRVRPISAQSPLPAQPVPAARPVSGVSPPAGPAPPPQAVTRPAGPGSPPPPPGATPAQEFRKVATRALTVRLRDALKQSNASAVSEMEALFEQQGELEARAEAISAGVAALEGERAALQALVKELGDRSSELDIWLLQNDPGEEEIDVDRAIVPLDALSRQALEAQAEDLAIEDALYELDRAVKRGAIDPEPYLKQCRQMCRQQFFCRALYLKVQAARGAAMHAYLAGVGGSSRGGAAGGGAGVPSREDLLRAAARR